MQLQDLQEGFDSLGVAIVAMSQEEKDLSKAPSMAQKNGLSFPVVHDLQHEQAPQFDRTNGYFIDANGIVQQIFPMSAYMRPSSTIVLDEIEGLMKRADEGVGSDEGESPQDVR